MRIWTIHPKYLDRQGLLAVWRETLLAKKVLEGNTIGYKNHSQLERFKQQKNPLKYIDSYLFFVYQEATARGYIFDRTKFGKPSSKKISENIGQIAYERQHLLKKLQQRSPDIYNKHKDISLPENHPLFIAIPGNIQDRERI